MYRKISPSVDGDSILMCN